MAHVAAPSSSPPPRLLIDLTGDEADDVSPPPLIHLPGPPDNWPLLPCHVRATGRTFTLAVDPQWTQAQFRAALLAVLGRPQDGPALRYMLKSRQAPRPSLSRLGADGPLASLTDAANPRLYILD
jgi:hypothetical protein